MSATPHTPDDFNDLRRQARLNELRLKIARQNEALSALRREGYRDTLEGFYDTSNYFDIRDYLVESPRFGGAIPTTLGDRDEGRNFPIFRTEQELAVIRGAARLLTSSNPIAVGVLASLTNYVIGNGFLYAATPGRLSGARNAAEFAATASAVIDEFLTENDWSGDLDRELFQRSRVDGEYFLGLWHVGNGHVQARAIEPDQVTEPGDKTGLEEWLGCSQNFTSNWSFGVHTDENDAQAVHGFYVQWSNRDTEWDYFPGGNEPITPPQGSGMWLEHAKLNVVRSVKRGLSDFFPIDGNLELARRVLRNMGEGSAVQAAIAWIQEVAPGTTQAQVNTGTLSRADASYTTPTQQGASRTHYVQQYDPATILKVPSGQKYLPGPLGTQHAPNFITAAKALLRTVALRWNLPEHLVTGSAANNNFASSLVAETPFVKYAESQQQFFAQRDRKTLWRVLWFAWSAGRFGDVPWSVLKRTLEITVTPPQIEVRNPEKETRVRQMLNQAGILSRKTWSAQESLDYCQEQKNLAQEAAKSNPEPSREASTQDGSIAESGEEFGQHSEPASSSENVDEFSESTEAWDPAKHPRGGFPQNSGWFSKSWGSGLPAVLHRFRRLRRGRSSSAKKKANSAPAVLGSGKTAASQTRVPEDGASQNSRAATSAKIQTVGRKKPSETQAAAAKTTTPAAPTGPDIRPRLPRPDRGTWIKGTPGNGVFQYSDTPENRAAGVAGAKVSYRNQYIALGGFPPEFYCGGNAASASVKLDNPPKGTNADNLAADAKMRIKVGDPNWQRPKGYRWNHAGGPGSKTMELTQKKGHTAVAHKGSAALPRAARRIGKATGGVFAGLQVYTVLRDALQAAGVAQPDYQINEAPYYFVAEDGSVFTVDEPTWFKSAKQVFVAGPRAGQSVNLTSEELKQYKNAAEKQWGRYEPGHLFREPRFHPGEQRKTLPYFEYWHGIPREAGWLDENGIHRYPIERPPFA